MEVGVVFIIFQDIYDMLVFELLLGEMCLWGDIDVIGLFDVEIDMNDVVVILENYLLFGVGFVYKIE